MRITEAVDPVYEATAFLAELEVQGKSPIVVFENIKGASMPVLANLLGSRARMALAFDTDRLLVDDAPESFPVDARFYCDPLGDLFPPCFEASPALPRSTALGAPWT